MIGDPSGKSADRNLLSQESVDANISKFKAQFEMLDANMLKNIPSNKPLLPLKFVNNIDFYKDLSAIGFLRDIGRHFRLNTMIAKDSVKSRLASDNGISYTEFSYQIL